MRRGYCVTAIVIVLAFSMIIAHFLLGRRAFARDDRPSGGGGLSGVNPDGVAFLGGFVAVAALVQLSAAGRIDIGSSLVIGTFFAAVAFVLSKLRRVPGVEPAGNLLYSLLGLIALLPALAGVTEPQICGVETNVPLRISAIALFVLVAVVSGVAGFFIGGLRSSVVSSVGLGWFGAVDVVLFLTSPVGVVGGPGPMVLGLSAAVVLGAIIGVAPELGLMTVGVGLALIVMLTSAYGSTLDCQDADSVGSVSAFVAYGLVFCVLRLVVGKLSKNRVE